MISVIIPTFDSERILLPALAALVAGAVEGLVREVVLAEGGSGDETRNIADAAGCEFLQGPADFGARLAAAAAGARGSWLLFLEPAAIVGEGWTREVGNYIDRAERGAAPPAATFRLAYDGYGTRPRIAEALAFLRLHLTGRPRAEQGLLISKDFYRAIGGHMAGASAHRELLARVGRRFAVLRTPIVLAALPAAKAEVT